MNEANVCKYLEWDSQFFGVRIARVSASTLTEETLVEINNWCAVNRIDCLYFLASSTDARTVRLAEQNKFSFVDIRVTLDLDVRTRTGERENTSNFTVRSATEGDLEGLKELAGRGYRDTRFYYDENFPESRCNELYETWILKSCRGWAKLVLVASHGNDVCGYLTCNLPTAEKGEIGLVGVSERAQGMGIGTALVERAIDWFTEKRVGNITVATQGRNVRAQRLYQRCGFATRSLEIWYHRWFTENWMGA